MSALQELVQLIGDLEDSTYYDDEDLMIHCIYCKAVVEAEKFDETAKRWVPVTEFTHEEDCRFQRIKKLASYFYIQGD